MSSRRRHRRIPFVCPVTLQARLTGDRTAGTTIDMSASGALIEVDDHVLQTGAFIVSFDEHEELADLALDARLVRIRTDLMSMGEERVAIGVQFHHLTSEELGTICAFLYGDSLDEGLEEGTLPWERIRPE